MNDTILLHRDGPVATLTLNRPDALNALDHAMIDALVERTTEVADDDSVSVVVLRAAGRHFMAGGDIRTFARQCRMRLRTGSATSNIWSSVCTSPSSSCTGCPIRSCAACTARSPVSGCR